MEIKKEIISNIKVVGSLIPIALIFISFLSCFFNYNYVIIGNIVGYSIFTNFVFVSYFSLNKRYCNIIRLAPVGLLIINIIDIIGYYFDSRFYDFWYVVVTSTFTFLIGLILDLKRRINL